MNAQRRRRIEEAIVDLDEVIFELQEVQEAEKEAFRNQPKCVRASEQGEAWEEDRRTLRSIISSLCAARRQIEIWRAAKIRTTNRQCAGAAVQ